MLELLIRMEAITNALQDHMEDHIDFEDLSEVDSKIDELKDDIDGMNNNIFGLYEMSLGEDD